MLRPRYYVVAACTHVFDDVVDSSRTGARSRDGSFV